jgi:CDP-glucose 4,6-dehydratase
LATAINSLKPDLVFHLAAQPLVRESYLNPLRTFEVNAGGTINILETIRNYSGHLTAVLITSDKVYRNIEMINGYREDDLIGGKDPYSGSKGMAELAIYSYFQSYFQKVAKEKRIVIARAGNVVGGGDWAHDRLIPDVIRAIEASGKVMIRKPSATRPWQHVLEPIVGYLKLGMCAENNESINGMAFNFGPLISETGSVYDFCENFLTALDLDPKKYLEIDLVPTMEAPEANLLALNCDKAYGLMGWSSKLTRNCVIDMTACWYKAYMNKSNLVDLTNVQINSYLNHG